MSELTKQALKVENNQSFPNNNAGLITPTALRGFNEDMIDSTVNQAVYTADSASFNSRINAITGSGGSVNTGSLLTTASFNNSTRNLTFTKGDSSTFAVNIPDVSGSTLPSGTISGSQQITALGFVSSSITGSSVVTASFSGNTLTFTKGDNSTFGVVIPDVSGSTILTGSFATTGSNVFRGNQTITGSLFVSSSSTTAYEGVYYKVSNVGGPNSNVGFVIDGRFTVNGPTTLSTLDIGSVFVSNLYSQTASPIALRNSLTMYETPEAGGNNLKMSISGAMEVSRSLQVGGTLTASIQEGFTLVGGAGNVSKLVPTSSFGGTGNGFPFSGSAVITGSLSVSETVKSQVYMNPQTLDGFTIPTGNNAMLVGPVAVSGSVVVEGNSNLLILSQITASALPSGVVSGSSQLTASYDLRYALSGSIPTIATGSFATTGSNTFIGNQTITGSLFLSSSVSASVIVPNIFGVDGFVVDGNMKVQNGTLNVPQAINAGGIYLQTIGRNSNDPINVDNGLNIRPGAPGIAATNVSVSGSIIVSQSVDIGGSLSVSGSAFINNLQNGITDVVVTYNTLTGELRKATLPDVLSSSLDAAEFWSTTTQSGSAGVSGSITFNNSGSVAGISVVNNRRVTISQAGTYNIQFSAQVETSGGADTLWVWFKKNGVNITDSASKVVLANNTAQIMTVNIFDVGQANDYYELAYQTLNGHARVLYEPASGNIPTIPSVILTINQIR